MSGGGFSCTVADRAARSRLQLLEAVNGPPLQRGAAWDSGGAAANFAAVVPPLLASPALSGALASDVSLSSVFCPQRCRQFCLSA